MGKGRKKKDFTRLNERTTTHENPKSLFVFLTHQVQTFSDNLLDFRFRSVDKFAQGEILFVNFVNAKVFHQVDIFYDTGLDELQGIDVERENLFKFAAHDERPLFAVRVGI